MKRATQRKRHKQAAYYILLIKALLLHLVAIVCCFNFTKCHTLICVLLSEVKSSEVKVIEMIHCGAMILEKVTCCNKDVYLYIEHAKGTNNPLGYYSISLVQKSLNFLVLNSWKTNHKKENETR